MISNRFQTLCTLSEIGVESLQSAYSSLVRFQPEYKQILGDKTPNHQTLSILVTETSKHLSQKIIGVMFGLTQQVKEVQHEITEEVKSIRSDDKKQLRNKTVENPVPVSFLTSRVSFTYLYNIKVLKALTTLFSNYNQFISLFVNKKVTESEYSQHSKSMNLLIETFESDTLKDIDTDKLKAFGVIVSDDSISAHFKSFHDIEKFQKMKRHADAFMEDNTDSELREFFSKASMIIDFYEKTTKAMETHSKELTANSAKPIMEKEKSRVTSLLKISHKHLQNINLGVSDILHAHELIKHTLHKIK